MKTQKTSIEEIKKAAIDYLENADDNEDIFDFYGEKFKKHDIIRMCHAIENANTEEDFDKYITIRNLENNINIGPVMSDIRRIVRKHRLIKDRIEELYSEGFDVEERPMGSGGVFQVKRVGEEQRIQIGYGHSRHNYAMAVIIKDQKAPMAVTL